jgi:hypothetical protein
MSISAQLQAIPPFEPRLHNSGGEEVYDDGRIHAGVDTGEIDGKRYLTIYHWTSIYPGNGFTVEALRWLRAQGFTSITANGIGYVDEGPLEPYTDYWLRMHAKGLVDVLLDDDGGNVTPATELS